MTIDYTAPAFPEVAERRARAATFLFLLFVAVCSIFALAGCSHLSQVVGAERHQAAAVEKQMVAQRTITKASVARDGAIANLTAQVKFLLSLPATAKTLPVADQLLDASLSLTGPPSGRESTLEQEVRDLLSSQAKNEATIARIEKEDAAAQAGLDSARRDLQAADRLVAQKDAALYTAAISSANIADEANSFVRDGIIALVGLAVIIGVLLFLKFSIKAAEATTVVASKVP